jgi:hypothetical protein
MGSHARKSLPVYDVKNQKRITHNGMKPIFKRKALPLWLNMANKMTVITFTNGTIAKIITSLRMSSAQATCGRSNRNKDARNIIFIFIAPITLLRSRCTFISSVDFFLKAQFA